MAISRLVSGAVDSLEPEDVSIVDADSAKSLGLGHNGQQDGDTVEVSLAQRLIATLEPVVGLDKIRATVHIDQDQSSSEESQEKYDPTVSALLSDQKSRIRRAAYSPRPAFLVPAVTFQRVRKSRRIKQDSRQTSMTERRGRMV